MHLLLTFKILDINYGKKNCGQMMDEKCLAKSVRVTKLVRATMEEISFFLECNKQCSDQIKVIHLLRDPRGRINSLIHSKRYESFSENKISALCNRQLQDIQTRKKLEKVYPKMFTELLYEDISSNALQVSKRLYNFTYNATPSLSITNWIINHTQSTKASRGKIFRHNSTMISTKWKTQLNVQLIHDIQQKCKKVINYLNLEMV